MMDAVCGCVLVCLEAAYPGLQTHYCPSTARRLRWRYRFTSAKFAHSR